MLRPALPSRFALRLVLPVGAVLASALALSPAARAQSSPDAVGVQSPAAAGARSVALAGAGVALGGDVWGGFNPAAWSTLTRREVAAYADQRYALPELRLAALRGAVPTRWATLAAGVQTFGYDEYRMTGGTVGASRAFGLGTTRRVHVGVAANVQSLTIQNYGSSTAVSVDLGVLTDVLPRLTMGARASNLLGTGFGGAPLPRHLTVGGAFRADARLTVVADLDKEVREDLSVRAGVEVRPVSILTLRAGAASGPRRLGFGIGVKTRMLTADVSADVHPDLGVTPALGFSAQF